MWINQWLYVDMECLDRGQISCNTMKGHSDSVGSVVFSKGGELLLSSSGHNTVRVWEVKTGAAVGEPLVDHTGCLPYVAKSEHITRIASGLGDPAVRLWGLAGGN